MSPVILDLEVFEQFGIGHKLADLPQALSGGEQARAAFALALLRGTPLILADEPTAELDEQSALDLLSAIRFHADRGVAFVLATHDRNVTDVSDDVLRLDRGRRVVRRRTRRRAMPGGAVAARVAGERSPAPTASPSPTGAGRRSSTPSGASASSFVPASSSRSWAARDPASRRC